jgi:signal transduction histidine kinase
MYRDSVDRNACFAAVLFSPGSGPVFEYRPGYGGESTGFPAISQHRQFQWMKLVKRESLLLVQGDPGSEIDTNQVIDLTGMITWQNGTPILVNSSFEVSQKEIPAYRTIARPSQENISIANFVKRAEHPTEPYLFHGIEVSKLTGIVTYFGDFKGRKTMFVQEGDESGIQMAWDNTNIQPAFTVGQLVEVSGRSRIRRFPVILEPNDIIAKGWGTLPKPAPFSPALLEDGNGQGRWVEAEGVIRSKETNGMFGLMTQYGTLPILVGGYQPTEVGQYIDALVHVRGALSLDSAGNACLLVPSPDYVEVQEHSPANPFAIPPFSIAQLAALDTRQGLLRRMKTSGVVTCLLSKGLYIQDGSGGAYVETDQARDLRPGDRVEVVGFPDNKFAALILREADVRKTGEELLPSSLHLSIDESVIKKYAGKLVSSEAVLIEQRKESRIQILTLQFGQKIFDAVGLTEVCGVLPQIPPGSRVAITGVCDMDQVLTPTGPTGQEGGQAVTALRIWLPTSTSVVILERPPWWTLRRMVWLGCIFASGLLGALIWVKLLRQRVTERTRQLQATMARLEKETRTSAMLAERDRLAGEIHDSLEQSLTAIMLQLDAANRQTDQPPEARKFVNMARNMAEFTRAEIQHAVWDLQSPLLANADLSTALQHVANQISSGFPEVKVEIIGSPRSLPSSYEHHLLRIAQEGITNAIKHAHAQRINVVLEYTYPVLYLRIVDDGSGFVVGTKNEIGQNGHFGLQGIRARASRLGAQLDITSQIGTGTVIAVKMKLDETKTITPPQKQEPL